MKRSHDAHRALSDTAKLRSLDFLHDHINRERRKPQTVGARATETPRPAEVMSERDQSTIEAGIWPVYTP